MICIKHLHKQYCTASLAYILGLGSSGLALVSRYNMLLQSDDGLFTQATALLDGSLLAYAFPPALNPIVAPLPHSISPHL